MGAAGQFKAGLRALIVEDEWLIGAYLEDMLTEWGFAVVAVAQNLETALLHSASETLDIALLDVNLGERDRTYPVADALRARGVPFVFVTGYGRAGIAESYRTAEIAEKPIDPADLAGAIRRALEGS